MKTYNGILIKLTSTEMADEQELPQNMQQSSNLQDRQISLPFEQLSINQNETIYNWQATKKNLKERFTFLFNNEVLSDVHFIVGREESQQRIPAHKFVLSAGSAVFDAMFNGTLKNESSEEYLPDVEPVAFLSLLRFLYSDEVSLCPDSVMQTLYTAKKYAVPALEIHCVEFLKCNLRSDNAFMLLTQARLFDEPQLASMCLEMIDRHTTDAMNAEGFMEIDLRTLKCVLERDALRIPELKIFDAVIRWAEAECMRLEKPVNPENMRSVLGDAFSLIRFPLMTLEEFAAGPAQSKLLTDREIVKLFLHFTLNPKPNAGFPIAPRCCLKGQEQTVNRFQQVEGRWGYSGTSDRIRFSTDHRIYVVGLGLYGSVYWPAYYDVDVNVIHASTGSIVASNQTTFSCDKNNMTHRVMFKEPAEIIPNEWYIASATIKGPDSRYGTKGMRKVVVDLPEGCFREDNSSGDLKLMPLSKVTFNFAYIAGQNNGTSVEDGQIPEIIFYT